MPWTDRKSTRLNSCHTVISTLSLHDALPISDRYSSFEARLQRIECCLGQHQLLTAQNVIDVDALDRSEEHTSELLSHSDLHSFPTRRSSDLGSIFFI